VLPISDAREQLIPVMANRIWRKLGSPSLFFYIAGLLLAACVAGGVIPQGEDIQGMAGKWGQMAVHLVILTGLNEVFSQWWFSALLALLFLNLLFCSLQRWKTLHLGIWISHAGMLVVLLGGLVSVFLGERGQVGLEKGVPVSMAQGRHGEIKLPFALKLTDFRIEYHREAGHTLTMVKDGAETQVQLKQDIEVPLAGDLFVRLRQAFPDLAMTAEGPVNRSQTPNNPAIQVEVRQGVKVRKIWIFENYPLFYQQHQDAGMKMLPELYYAYSQPMIRQYVSTVEVQEGGKKVADAVLQVNKPFKWRGIKLFQSGYDLSHGTVSILQASRDPGVPLVYLGFLILPLGILWTLIRRSGS